MNHRLDYPAEAIDLPPLQTVMKAQRYYSPRGGWSAGLPIRPTSCCCGCRFSCPNAAATGKPKLLHVVSNVQAIVDASSDYRGLKHSWLCSLHATRSASTGHWHTNRTPELPLTAKKCGACWSATKAASSCRRVFMSTKCTRDRAGGLADPPSILFVGYLRPDRSASANWSVSSKNSTVAVGHRSNDERMPAAQFFDAA